VRAVVHRSWLLMVTSVGRLWHEGCGESPLRQVIDRLVIPVGCRCNSVGIFRTN
jgi:hypothetical protein